MVGIWSTGREETERWRERKRERGKEGWRMKGNEGEWRWEDGAIGRQTPALLRKTNGWRGLCASVYVLYLLHRGRLIYNTNTREEGCPALSPGKLERRRARERHFKWERWTTRGASKHGQSERERAREEMEKSSAEREGLEDGNGWRETGSIGEESNLSGRGSKWQMLLLWPCSSRL